MSGRTKRKNTFTRGRDLEEAKPGAGGNWWETANMQTTPNEFSTNKLNFNESNEEEPPKKKPRKTTRKPAKSTKTLEKFSDSGSGAGKSQDKKSDNEKEQKPILINLEAKSPQIWSYGVIIIYLAVLACTFLQYGAVPKFEDNMMYGPPEDVIVLMGAKKASVILAGSWWRLLVAHFLHSGIIHLAIIMIFAVLTACVERDTGFWRAFFVFMVSGTYGLILSSLLVPEFVSCGATGCIFGFIGLMLADLFSGWRANQHKGRDLGIILALILVGIILGLTPFIDNFLNIGGFIMGLLFALMLLPNLTFGRCERICHGLIAFLAFPTMTLIFCVCLVTLYRSIEGWQWCKFCAAINCINIKNWCKDSSRNLTQTIQIVPDHRPTV